MNEEKSAAMGIRHFVRKPINGRDLGKVIRDALEAPTETDRGADPR